MDKAKTSNEAKKKESAKKSAKKKADLAQPEAQSEPVEPLAGTQAEAASKETEQKEASQPKEEVVSQLDGVELPAASGKAGVLGGAKDRGVKPEDKLALPAGRHFTYERVHSLNPKSFYCAMRWEYRVQGKSPEEGKRWWANKKILVTNPVNGNQVVVRAVDYGPHENTGLTISLSPAALEALALEIGGEVNIEFADQKALLGVVNR
jgi:hypothetical protein